MKLKPCHNYFDALQEWEKNMSNIYKPTLTSRLDNTTTIPISYLAKKVIDSYLLFKLSIPYLDRDTLELNISGSRATLSYQKKDLFTKVPTGDWNYLTLELPSDHRYSDLNKTVLEYEDGILTVSFPLENTIIKLNMSNNNKS